jgi:hypothetical protein
MRSLTGFNNSAIQGSFASGQPILASELNKLGSAINSAQTMMSNDITFFAGTTGSCYGLPQQSVEPAPGPQQFQIVIQPYTVGEDTTSFSIIRVVKGEVVWSPKLTTDSILPSNSCTTQTTIENWYALPTFPIIDDENSTYIGDGGIRVPNVALVDIGIFIFKPTLLPIDVDPIIVALPDYVPSCPVTPPFTPPVAGATWEIVKIGSATYIEPDPEATPSIAGGWQITQNFIGSMTLPGGGGGGGVAPAPPLPAQLKNVDGGGNTSPFQCVITQVNDQRYLQIATGSCTFTQSNMPIIYNGAFSHSKQAWFDKVQICPNGTRTDFNEMWPNTDFDPDPSFSNITMEGGGGYKIDDTADPLTLFAFKWDVDTNVEGFEDIPVPSPATKNLPTLALILQSNPTDFNKIQQDKGPSIYENTMNVQKMTGYTEGDTGLPGDWGHCHTTWMNPRKIGYNYKAIATLTPEPNTFGCFVNIEQVGVPAVCNTIQAINFYGEAASGVAVISAIIPVPPTPENPTPPLPLPVPSVIPFPVVSLYTPLEVVLSDELAMFRCLNSIPGLTGNVQVSKGLEGQYFVTFINALQGLPVPLLEVDTSGAVAFEWRFQVVQYHTGDINLETPAQLGMTQLMNVEDMTEEDDPFYANKDSDPSWKDIVNKENVIACKDFSGDVTWEGVNILGGETAINPDFTIVGSCSDSCDHPFQVKRVSYVAEEYGEFSICTGMVNNVIPSNMEDTVLLLNGQIYLSVAYNSSDRIFPGGITINIDDEVPDSTKDVSYIAIARIVDGQVQQLITGSLWGDRIQVGAGESEQAFYYYAQV